MKVISATGLSEGSPSLIYANLSVTVLPWQSGRNFDNPIKILTSSSKRGSGPVTLLAPTKPPSATEMSAVTVPSFCAIWATGPNWGSALCAGSPQVEVIRATQ
jgi:hypothetical protein